MAKCEGHNGAKAGLNAVAKVLCGQADELKQRAKLRALAGTAAVGEAAETAKDSTTPPKHAAANPAKPPKKTALREVADREQHQGHGQSEVRFAEEVAAAATAGAAAAAQAQVDTVAAGGIITDGLGLLSPFARGAAAGSPPLSLASPAETKRVQKRNRDKKKLEPEPQPEWARAEQLGMQLPIKHTDQAAAAAKPCSRGGTRTIQKSAFPTFEDDGSKGAQEGMHYSGQKYHDLIGLARGFKAECVLPQDKTGVVPMPGVQTIELPAAYTRPVWRQPKSFIKAQASSKQSLRQTTGVPANSTDTVGNVGAGSRRQVAALELLQAGGWAVDYECDSVDEAWLLSPQGGNGRLVLRGANLDFVTRSRAHLVLLIKCCTSTGV